MKKIHLLAKSPQFFPVDFWRRQIPVLQEIEFQEETLDHDVLKPKWKSILQESSGVILQRAYSFEVLSLLVRIPRLVLEMKCADLFAQDKSKSWWPECVFREILHEGIVRAAPNLDTSAIAYITGQGSEMLASVSVAVQLGFRKINIVFPSSEIDLVIAESLQRLYFDTELVLLKNTDLVLQKNNGALLINTVDFSESPDLRENLSYLNFILADGLVVDTQTNQKQNSMMDEAAHVGLRILTGDQIRARSDWRIWRRVLGSMPISEDQYENLWSLQE